MLAKVRRFAVMLDECRFEIEQVKMTGRSSHKQLHHLLRFRRMMQNTSEHPAFVRAGRQEPVPPEEARERNPTQAPSRAPQKIPARHWRLQSARSMKR